MQFQRYFSLLIVMIGGLSLSAANAQTKRLANTLPDLSGLVWVAGDSFLAFHDAKNPDENARPRVSMLWLPQSLDGITWNPIALDWPSPQGLSSDLESASRIPGHQSLSRGRIFNFNRSSSGRSSRSPLDHPISPAPTYGLSALSKRTSSAACMSPRRSIPETTMARFVASFGASGRSSSIATAKLKLPSMPNHIDSRQWMASRSRALRFASKQMASSSFLPALTMRTTAAHCA